MTLRSYPRQQHFILFFRMGYIIQVISIGMNFLSCGFNCSFLKLFPIVSFNVTITTITFFAFVFFNICQHESIRWRMPLSCTSAPLPEILQFHPCHHCHPIELSGSSSHVRDFILSQFTTYTFCYPCLHILFDRPLQLVPTCLRIV